MGYKVDFDALDTLCSQISQQAGGWKDQLEAVGNSINDLLVSDKITGQGAENIKSYFQSVHVAIIQSLLALLQSHAANCLMYKSDYQTNIDSSLHAVINSEELFDIRRELTFQRSNTWSVDSKIRSTLTNISYLVSINLESSDTIDNTYATINRDLLNLESDITQLENSHLNSDFDGTQEMIASITALINEYLSTDKSAKSEYTPQQLADSEVYARLYLANEALKEEQSDKADELQLAYEHETERLALLEEEEAQRREEEGWLNAVLAVGTIAIGAIAIVATWGAATPIVVTACVAGGSTIMYGTSNLVEAGQDIYYGSIGDIETVAFNPIRDTVFCGNQELYDIWGTVSTTVAGMIIPSGQAFAALRAAHPTAVLVATSAANGAISAGTSSVKQQFAETGSLGEINWGKVAMDAGVGGLVGGTTGAVGAGISNGATTLLSKSATISSLLNSESAVTRITTNFAIGSVAEVSSGMGTRFVGGMLTSGGDFKGAGMQAINPQNILFDAALGGTMRSFNGIQKPQQQSFADMMSPEDAAKYNAFLEHGGDSGFTPQELKAFDKLDEALLVDSIDYDEILDARKNASLAFGTISDTTTPKVIYGTDDIAKYEFNMIENPGPLTELPNIPKSDSPAKNFYGGRYNVEELQEDQIMYRAGNSQNPYGRWFTSEPPTSIVNVRIDRAVKPYWINPKTGVCESTSYIDTVYAIKVPKGTTVYSGPIGPQGESYLGGYDIIQKYIYSPWNFEVVGKMPLK